MQDPVCGICGAPVRQFSASLWVHVRASVAPHAVELAYVDRPSEWIRRARNRELPTRDDTQPLQRIIDGPRR